ncbi:response regulator transcription factor [Massilia sp. TS11]|uniref:response regulator transcription factor n=1 Tax=Massilia sp. TS11 TaxID=2908003 RepID=UPI001EDA517D|nr:response regulator transcription factor [Massilia sp. TS11]MCG2585682.1 response regulator transcription factor [Massilia sp. TS11]
MSHTILMIEDDRRLADMVGTYLTQNGYTVEHCGSGAEGLARLRQPPLPDLVLLDLMLPDTDGLELCKRIRTQPLPLASLPIVMLTAKGDPLDRVIGLELGADDYVAKPFEPRELLARLRAVLRRPPLASTDSSEPQMQFGQLAIFPAARMVRLRGQEVSLTSYQFDLLLALAERAGRVLTREQLLDAVKGASLDPFDRSIDVHIGRLRAAIEDDPRQPRRILTVRGAGYVFAKAQDV